MEETSTPGLYEEYMTLHQAADTLGLLREATPDDIERVGPLRRPSPVLGRLIMEHGLETVVVPSGEGKQLTRALSPVDVNYLFDVLNPPKS